jgi:hypothetical protein
MSILDEIQISCHEKPPKLYLLEPSAKNPRAFLVPPEKRRMIYVSPEIEKGGVPFRVGHANPGGSRVEGDATDAEGSRRWGWKGS